MKPVLQGQQVLAVGLSGPLGICILEALHRAGAETAVIWDTGNSLAWPELADAEMAGLAVYQAGCDIGDPQALEDKLDEVLARVPNARGLVCYGGQRMAMPFEDMDIQDFDRALEQGAVFAMRALRKAAPVLVRNMGGAVAHVLGEGFRQPGVHHVAQAAAEGALDGYTRTAAMDGALRNVRVNALIAHSQRDAEEIAQMVVYLLSPLSAYITGHTFSTARVGPALIG